MGRADWLAVPDGRKMTPEPDGLDEETSVCLCGIRATSTLTHKHTHTHKIFVSLCTLGHVTPVYVNILKLVCNVDKAYILK